MGNSLLDWVPLENSPKSLAINGVLDNERIADLLKFYMGKNTPERQGFIIDKLRVEKDLIEIKE